MTDVPVPTTDESEERRKKEEDGANRMGVICDVRPATSQVPLPPRWLQHSSVHLAALHRPAPLTSRLRLAEVSSDVPFFDLCLAPFKDRERMCLGIEDPFILRE